MSDYVTLEEVKSALDLMNLSYADNELRMAIPAASRGVEQYCQRVFTSGGTTSEARFFTPHSPALVDIDDLVTLDTIESDYDGDGVYETLWDTSQYVLQPYNSDMLGLPWEQIRALPRAGRWFTVTPGFVKVTGVWGWTEAPAGVKQATMIMAERLVQRARSAPFGVVGIGFDNSAVRIPSVDPDVRFLLEPYRKGGEVMVA